MGDFGTSGGNSISFVALGLVSKTYRRRGSNPHSLAGNGF